MLIHGIQDVRHWLTVLDAESLDAIGEDAHGAVVVQVELVGDVAMGEDIARLAVGDDTLGHPRVGAANPEDGGRLSSSIFLEQA